MEKSPHFSIESQEQPEFHQLEEQQALEKDIKDEIAPEGWRTATSIANEFGVNKNQVAKLIEEFELQHSNIETSDNFRVIKKYKNRKQLGEIKKHYAPVVVNFVTNKINERRKEILPAPEG